MAGDILSIPVSTVTESASNIGARVVDQYRIPLKPDQCWGIDLQPRLVIRQERHLSQNLEELTENILNLNINKDGNHQTDLLTSQSWRLERYWSWYYVRTLHPFCTSPSCITVPYSNLKFRGFLRKHSSRECSWTWTLDIHVEACICLGMYLHWYWCNCNLQRIVVCNFHFKFLFRWFDAIVTYKGKVCQFT